MDDNLHHGHRERMRARLLKEGLAGFAPHEVLEMLMYFTVTRGNTNETGHNLLREFKTLKAVLNATPTELTRVKGVGEKTAFLLSFMGELTRYMALNSYGENPRLKSSGEAGKYCIDFLYGQKYECFAVLCLNAAFQLTNAQILQEGTIDSAQVYVRKIVEVALRHGAYAVIVCHNHPSGELTPSPADVDVTKRTLAALETVDVLLADHLIVSESSYHSMRGQDSKTPMLSGGVNLFKKVAMVPSEYKISDNQ